MPYTKQDWENGNPATPLSAERLAHMEQGIEAAMATAEDPARQGIDGEQGPAGTITSVSAVALAAGASPTITLGGTPSARTMAFGIPSGEAGAAGTITSVTVSMLPAGSSPTVTLGGTPNARTIEIGIPGVDNPFYFLEWDEATTSYPSHIVPEGTKIRYIIGPEPYEGPVIDGVRDLYVSVVP